MSAIYLLAVNPVEHVIDKPIYDQWYVSNVTVMLLLGAVITALLVIPAARRISVSSRKAERTTDDFRAQGAWANLVESVCVYLREQVFRSVLNEETDRFTPILWTFFWFILICNLMGLIPLADITAILGINPNPHEPGHYYGIGGTATQSIWVTGALATVSFLFYNATALFRSPLGFLKHLTAGAPWFMWVIMVPVEILGSFIKPFALAIRLFANMTGGHLVIAVFLSFVGPLIQSLGPVGYGVAIVPMLGAVAINMLELMVAFIQAFIFTFLTCLFLSQLVIHEHEPESGHSPEHHPHAAGVDPQQVVAAAAVPLKEPGVSGSTVH
jgi:F-type H+-transporting ATPase subunit a